MRRTLCILVAGLMCLQGIGFAAAPAENTKPLIGSWSGKATGPQGGPPTGDITVIFEREGSGTRGKIVVKGAGGGAYSGQISEIQLKNRLFSALAVFKFGENPLEVRVSGPLKGRAISGSFSVVSKGQILGDGTFDITKDSAAKAAKK
jgi:hypothetical protein